MQWMFYIILNTFDHVSLRMSNDVKRLNKIVNLYSAGVIHTGLCWHDDRMIVFGWSFPLKALWRLRSISAFRDDDERLWKSAARIVYLIISARDPWFWLTLKPNPQLLCSTKALWNRWWSWDFSISWCHDFVNKVWVVWDAGVLWAVLSGSCA